MTNDTDFPVTVACPVCYATKRTTALQLESGEVQCATCGCDLSLSNAVVE